MNWAELYYSMFDGFDANVHVMLPKYQEWLVARSLLRVSAHKIGIRFA
jgi:hypothetical protein